ncbi:MAG: O-antigen ligase family protein [Desulfobacteraceae bacterium]|nr:O-antigen ligase family protein [Desulfobacteraceae bacterium]
MTILFFLAIITQIITWGVLLISNPELSSKLPDVDRLGKLFLFIPIAWGLRKFESPFKYIFLASLAGFFLGLVTNSDFLHEIGSAFKGQRIDFGIKNAQHSSMIFGLIFIISFLNLFVFERLTRKNSFLLAVLLLLSICGLVFTQTRQSYLAVMISILVSLPLAFKMGFRLRKIILFFTILFISVLIFRINIGYFSQRFNDIKSVWISVEKIRIEDKKNNNFKEKIDSYVKSIPPTSAGIRIKSWLEALKWIVQKPFFGWGSEARKLVIKKSDNFTEDLKKQYGHLHNYFIEVLVSYGVFGLSIIFIMYWIFINSIYNSKTCADGNKIFITGFCFAVYWLVINNFESFNSFWTGVFIHNIFLGAFYSRYLKFKLIND